MFDWQHCQLSYNLYIRLPKVILLSFALSVMKAHSGKIAQHGMAITSTGKTAAKTIYSNINKQPEFAARDAN